MAGALETRVTVAGGQWSEVMQFWLWSRGSRLFTPQHAVTIPSAEQATTVLRFLNRSATLL